MRCHRCQGLMVPEHFADSRIDTGEPRFDGWRCINCGVITDPVIAAQRRTSAVAMPTTAGLRRAA